MKPFRLFLMSIFTALLFVGGLSILPGGQARAAAGVATTLAAVDAATAPKPAPDLAAPAVHDPTDRALEQGQQAAEAVGGVASLLAPVPVVGQWAGLVALLASAAYGVLGFFRSRRKQTQ